MRTMAAEEVAQWTLYLVVGLTAAQGLWLAFLTFRMQKRAEAERAKAVAEVTARVAEERETALEDVFLLHRSGLLLKHYTRRLRPNIDSDILSGMLVAVQDFIKDSFRGEGGALNEIRFGDLRIVVAEGKWTIIAAVVRGRNALNIQPELLATIQDLESKHEDLFFEWDGTMDSLPEVNGMLMDLVEGRYRGRLPGAGAAPTKLPDYVRP